MEALCDGGTRPRITEEALWILVTVCRLSGRVEHREALERFITKADSAVTASVRAAIGGHLDPRLRIAGWAGRSSRSPTIPSPLRSCGSPARRSSPTACQTAARPCAVSRARRPPGTAGTHAMQASILLALEAYQTGQWDEAWRLAETAAGLCASRGYQLLRKQAQAVLAFVAASRGDAERAQAIADEIVRWAAPRGITSLVVAVHYAAVLAALAQSDFQSAYQRAVRISPAGDIPSREPLAAWSLFDFVEAALRTDRTRRRRRARPGRQGGGPRGGVTAHGAAVDRRDGDDRAG